MRKFILFILSILGLQLSLIADDVNFTASAPNVVEVGEQFQITYTINKKGSNLQVAPFKEFSLLYGPNTSSSSSVQIINGKMTQSVSYTYTYVVLANQEGSFEIPPATIKVGRKTYSSNLLKIEVVKGAKSSQKSNVNQNSSVKQNNAVSNENLFVKVNVNKTSLYQGDFLIATIKVYTRADLAGFKDIKFPSYNGFWTQDIETPSQISLQRENYNGQVYNVGIFKKTLLYPQHSGQITIEPFELECQVRQAIKRRPRSIFDDFFGSYQNVLKKVVSQPIVINVKNLPGNQPATFNGAVGNFNFSANVDNLKVKANEAITLKIKINGSGNLKLINPPKLNFPPDFESYDPKTNANIKNTINGQVGSKTFEYLIIPRYAGKFRIAPVEISYFDIKTKSYKTFTSSEFNIEVEKGDQAENLAVVSGFSKEDVKYIGSDIRYIKTKPITLSVKGSYLFGSVQFYLTYIVSLVLFILIIILRKEQIKKNANIVRVKNRKAGRVSKKRLKQAKVFLKEQRDSEFFDEILHAIWGYLSDKLNIPLVELSKENTMNHDKITSLNNDVRNELMDIIEACEIARYAPGNDDNNRQEIYSKASKLIIKLEQKIK